MMRLRNLRDESGAAAVEFALAVPVLITLIWGILQVSLLFQANAGMQQALGQAARYATIYPTPSTDDISDKITSAKFGVGNGTWDTPVIDTSHASDGYYTISVSYDQPTDFLFFAGPNVTLSASKKVYLST